MYFGKMRQGKTLLMVRDVIKLLQKGEVVYTNFYINWDGTSGINWFTKFLHKLTLVPIKKYPDTNLRLFRSWDDISEVSACTVALDEGWLHFNSYTRLPIDQQRRLLQSGKRRIDYMYTSQRPMQTDINMRWNTDVFVEAKKYTFFGINFHKFSWYDLKEDDSNAVVEKVREVTHKDGSFDTIDMAIKRAWLIHPKKIYNAYDTEFEIYESEEAQKLADAKRRIDDKDRLPVLYPLPSYWSDIKSFIKGKHDYRFPVSRKRTTQKKVKRSMVGRLHLRSDIDPVRVPIDGIRR